MTYDNTLLGRCTVAYAEAFEAAITSQAVAPQSRRAGVAAVLEHLAAELLVMNQRNERLSVHECARLLIDAAQGAEVDA
jgi:ribosomal protein S18 acetylase RimI-like enzyme